jgi:hypothetical protein
LDRAILSVKTDVGYELESAVSNGEKIIDRAMKMHAPEMAAAQYNDIRLLLRDENSKLR